MEPKIQAAIDFVMQSNKEDVWAAIGDLRDASKIFGNEEGGLIRKFSHSNRVVWGERKASIKKDCLTLMRMCVTKFNPMYSTFS